MGKVYHATEMSDEHAAPGDVTKLLHAWADGDKRALDELIPLVYAEIHRLARNRLRREGPGKRLQTTEVVNEAYLQLVRQRHVRWQSRAHPTHEYVVLGTKRAGTMEEELLAAAANGFRLVGQSH